MQVKFCIEINVKNVQKAHLLVKSLYRTSRDKKDTPEVIVASLFTCIDIQRMLTLLFNLSMYVKNIEEIPLQPKTSSFYLLSF
jgi:hypothetical protein